MTLTNADLDAWERLAEAATPGPWRMQTAACDHPDADEHVAIKGGGRLVVPCVEEPADAALFAAARLAIPALVAEVRRLRGVATTIGARLRDMIPADLDRLPDGARFEDLREPAPRRLAYSFTKRGRQWISPELTTCSSERLRELWCDDDEDYHLAHLPESP